MIRATHVGDGPLHFLWHFDDRDAREAQVLAAVARRIVALGWGIDLAVADGSVISDRDASALEGTKWTPRRSDAASGLRVPVAGTLGDILQRHRRFLTRVGADHFDPPPPLGAFATVEYQPDAVRNPHQAAVFSLLDATESGLRSYDAATQALTVAGMTRHAVRSAAERSRRSEAWINQVVLGHGEARGASHIPVRSPRFAYVPLPSLERRNGGEVVGRVRRVMVALSSHERDGEIGWVRRALVGQLLKPGNGTSRPALLGTLPQGDLVTRRYLDASPIWTSVTPVVLPGYDDPAHYRRRLGRAVGAGEQKDLLAKLDRRTDELIRKAIRQAGFSTELADHADVEWRRGGFWAGTEQADRYGVPNHLKQFSRLHVRIRWRDQSGMPVNIDGPCVLGSGRFYGLGLLAA